MHIVAAGHADNGNIMMVLDTANHFKERNYCRSDLVAAYIHHPFFEIVPCQARDGSVVFGAKQHHAAFEV